MFPAPTHSHTYGTGRRGSQTQLRPLHVELLLWTGTILGQSTLVFQKAFGFPSLGNISQGLFICFDCCALSKLKTSVKCFLDCKCGPCLACSCVCVLLHVRRITERKGHLEGKDTRPTGNEKKKKSRSDAALP